MKCAALLVRLANGGLDVQGGHSVEPLVAIAKAIRAAGVLNGAPVDRGEVIANGTVTGSVFTFRCNNAAPVEEPGPVDEAKPANAGGRRKRL
jgi:secreted PhoX family phosphatase